MSEQLSTPNASPKPDNLNAILYGGVLILVAGLIPFVNFTCCLPTIGGAMFAVYYFTNQYSLTLTASEGAKLGILAALVGGFAGILVGDLLQILGVEFYIKQGESIGRFIAERLGGAEAARQADLQAAKRAAEGLKLTTVLIQIVSVVIFALIFGGIGGATGAAIFKKGKPEVPQA
jgi:hypothetical protein